MNRVLLMAALVLVAAGLIGGFMVAGGPQYARKERHDEKRLWDLSRLGEYERCRVTAAADDKGCSLVTPEDDPRDPVTDQPYDLRRGVDGMIEICATFETDPASLAEARGMPLHVEGQRGCLRYRMDGPDAGPAE